MGVTSSAVAFEKHPNGWIYPMNRQPTNEEWNSWHSYATHVGHDYMQSAGKPVRAIADGWIEDWNNSLSYYGSKTGAPGGAVLLKHKAVDSSGKEKIFYAVYGHDYIVPRLKHKGKKVSAGEIIAYTHKYYYYGKRADHIHLGIRPDEMECCGMQFRGFSSDGSDHGWVDPKVFLNTHHPKRLFFEKEELQVASFPGAENIAWYPRDKECDEAERWFELKDNGEVKDEINQDSACSIVNQKREEEAQRVFQAEQQAQEEAYRQELEARNNRPWWQKVVDFIKDIFKIHHTNAQEIDDELKNLVVYRTITIYTDNSGNIVDGDVGVRSGGDYYSGYYPNYTSNGSGATEHAQPGESDHPGYVHNVSMDDTEMDISGVGNYNHEWTFYHEEVPTVNIRVRLKNKTNHKIGRNDVTIKWFESPNHTFNPQYDHHFATDHNRESIGPFKHHSHSDELVERKINLN